MRGLAALTMASPALAQGGEPVAVSAPGVLSLFALALIAIGFGRRRRR
ncbi:MAG: hypothetical protein V2J14_00845 [Erythrobacter sp.]|nr:hypothetical protein [Erythrobacter sp.]